MIQNRLNDKDKDVRGLKKQTSSLLNCAWEKGYVAGFDDGYKSGRQAEARPKGEWEYVGMGIYECTNCKAEYEAGIADHCNINNSEFKYCPNCGADMRGNEI